MDQLSVPPEHDDFDQVDVLVVDDDHDVRTSFACILRDVGYRVDEAEDGFVALERLRTKQIGVMVLDVFMPVLDGLRLLDRLDDPPPVLLMTAHTYDEEVMARRDKVFMYIQKPVPPQHLIAAVASALMTASAGTS